MTHLWYNGVALHELGDITVTGPQRSYDPPDAPQRIVHGLRVVVDLFPCHYVAGHRDVSAIAASLKAQHGILRWTSLQAVEDFIHRRVTVREADLPEDPNSWGTYHRRIVLSFGWVENLTDADAGNLGTGGVATFTRTGGGSPVSLGNITQWQEGVRNLRLHDRRATRDRSDGRLSVAGFIRADTGNPDLTARRAALIATKEAMLTAMDGASGTLVRGATFNRLVEIEEVTAEVNQAVTGIPYSFTARFQRWPESGDYSTERFTVSEASRREDGTATVMFRGSIQSYSYAAATSRLDALRTAVQDSVTTGGRVVRVLGSDLDASYISSGDASITGGDSLASGFVEMSFNETWQVFAPAGSVTRPISMRYAVRRRRDLLGLREAVEVSGDLFADTTTLAAAASYAAGNFLDAFFTAKGWQRRRQDDREIGFDAADTWTGGAVALDVESAQKVGFNLQVENRLAGDEAILECDATESVTHSGIRWVAHQRPDGPPIFENSGIEGATRQISGTVRSASLEAARAYATGKRKLLASHASPPDLNAHEDPPSMSTRFEWVARPEHGIADATREGGTGDVAVHTVEFRFQERLPLLPLS